jgi:hypothetical protein
MHQVWPRAAIVDFFSGFVFIREDSWLKMHFADIHLQPEDMG